MITPEKINEVVVEMFDVLRAHKLTEIEGAIIWDALGENLFWAGGKISRREAIIKMWEFANHKIRSELERLPQSPDDDNVVPVVNILAGKAKRG